MEDPKPRLHFVDVLRLLALLQMVNGHTLHALLTASVRQGAFYEGYLYFRGLVSVAFMLASGLAFYVTVLLREQTRSEPAERRRRVARALEIIAGEMPVDCPADEIARLPPQSHLLAHGDVQVLLARALGRAPSGALRSGLLPRKVHPT